jgi:integrase/recombinase XerD
MVSSLGYINSLAITVRLNLIKTPCTNRGNVKLKSVIAMVSPTQRRKDAQATQMAEVNSTSGLVALWLHGFSPETVRSYEYDIRCFIGFMTGEKAQKVTLNDLDLRTVKLNDVQAYVDFLLYKKYSPASLNRQLAAVRSLFTMGFDCGYLTFNAPAKVKGVKQKDSLAERILSEFETMQLLATAKSKALQSRGKSKNSSLSPKEKIALRNHLLLEFLYYTGARVSEVARLTWRDIKSNRNGLGQVTLFGKGGKTRTVLLSETLYLDVLNTRISKDPAAAVFASRKGDKPLQVRQIRKIVNDTAAEAGLDGNVSPHWLRHSHASHSLDRGAPPQLVQQTLGHQSLHTLTRYAHARPSDSSGLYLPR